MTRNPERDEDGPTAAPVPPPIPPGDSDAWYAPDVCDQYAITPGTVVTVRRRAAGFAYTVREPALAPAERATLDRIRDHFERGSPRRPLTREGVVERAHEGVEPKYERALDRLLETGPAARRRLDYYALRDLRLLGAVTPLALDDRVEVADATADPDGRLVVHTTDFAPAVTDLPADAPFVERVAAERRARYTVTFAGFDVPVVVYRDRLLGSDRFATKYAVVEPDLLPGDADLVAECRTRIWEINVDGLLDAEESLGAAAQYDFVAARAREVLDRRLTARNAGAWLAATRYRLRTALADLGLTLPPVDERYARDRLDDLVYHVLRDLVGEGPLTVPIRDPNLEDVEANRVGERVKVVPRAGVVAPNADTAGTGSERVPTNLAFDTEIAFVNVVTKLAASDGVELNASNPSAKVNLDTPGVTGTVRCAVALPVISEDGPHVSIRKQAADALTPVDLVAGESLAPDLVALLWLFYEHRGVVLFSGPTGVGKTTLMNAHMPFVPFDDRPISIDEGSREVRIPHETGVSLTTRDHENDFKRVTMADLMTESNYLNPDVEVIAEINTPASFRTFAEILNTGHGVVGTTHAEDVQTLVNRVVEQGLPPYLLEEIDLVVFPHASDGNRYVARAVEFVTAAEYDRLTRSESRSDGPDPVRAGRIEKAGTTVHWNEVYRRQVDGAAGLDYEHPHLGDPARHLGLRSFHRVATATDRTVEAVEAEFHRKHRYVEFLVREGVTDADDLFDLLSALRTDEAATVERLRADANTTARTTDGREEA